MKPLTRERGTPEPPRVIVPDAEDLLNRNAERRYDTPRRYDVSDEKEPDERRHRPRGETKI